MTAPIHLAQILAMPAPTIHRDPRPGEFNRLSIHCALILSVAKEHIQLLLKQAAESDYSGEIKELDTSVDDRLGGLKDEIDGACVLAELAIEENGQFGVGA